MLGRIRWRLTMGYVGILALILLLFGVVVVSVFEQQVIEQQNRLLTAQAKRLAKNLNYLKEGQRVVDESPGTAWVTLTPGSTEMVNYTSQAPSLELPAENFAREAILTGETNLHRVRTREGETVWVASAPMTLAGRPIGVLQYARSPEVVDGIVNRLVFVLALVGGGALVLAAVGGLYMSRRAMRPVRDAFERQRAFIADASHELKTPLTLIRADAEVLSRGAKDPEDGELFDDLLGETDRMSALLSDLLTLARLDAGKLAVAREPFNLAAVVSETSERFAARADSEGKRLEVHLDGPQSGKLVALGDAERAAQILAALLDNALRFTPPGGLVAVECREAEKGRVEATVADAGPGVPPEDLPRVFDRFYRAEEARTRKGGGTGLGLAIARDLARAQNGDLSAENTPEGALFTLDIPAST